MKFIDRIAKVIGYEPRKVLKDRLKVQDLEIKDLQSRVEETDELSNLCLKEKEEIIEEFQNYRSIVEEAYGKYVRRIAGLPKGERELLCNIVPKHTSDRKIKEKIKFSPTHHSPNGFEDFLEKVAQCGYIDLICGGEITRKDSKKTIFNDINKDHGIFIVGGVFVNNNFGRRVYANTTARNEMEAFYVMSLLNSYFSK
ncbi:MAG: hypothetical protein KJ674_04865 [Nanoarchaeota archaeon]|nr:hypothetical protein [Nanoarchaeota archaeon]